MNTPWGKSDGAVSILNGVDFHVTLNHGGFKVSPEMLSIMPKKYVNPDGWYEEDVESCKVVLAFPHCFDTRTIEHAKKTWSMFFNNNGTLKG